MLSGEGCCRTTGSHKVAGFESLPLENSDQLPEPLQNGSWSWPQQGEEKGLSNQQVLQRHQVKVSVEAVASLA